jgi:tRNA threonylcarbamoyl adenosine modification protein YeaZ
LPPERLILAFDTSAAHCAAALVLGDRVLSAYHEPMATGQSERLLPMLDDLLAGAEAGWRDLSALAVGTGPGNFTGVRIAVSAARGLALGLGIPAHGVTGFEALAYGLPRPTLACLDARQGRLYLQRFAPGAEAPMMADAEDLPAQLADPGLSVVGHAAGALAARLGGRVAVQPLVLAAAMGLIAAARPESGAPRPAPLYLRAADAAPPREPPPVILP